MFSEIFLVFFPFLCVNDITAQSSSTFSRRFFSVSRQLLKCEQVCELRFLWSGDYVADKKVNRGVKLFLLRDESVIHPPNVNPHLHATLAHFEIALDLSYIQLLFRKK